MKRISRSLVSRQPPTATPLESRRLRRIAAREESMRERRESQEQIIPIDYDAHDGILSPLLHRTPRVRDFRPDSGYVHVSDLLSKTKCIRKIAIVSKHAIPTRARHLSLWDRIAFRQGDALHDLFREVTTEVSPDMIWGKWSCKCGYLFHSEPCTYAETDPDDICPHCDIPTDNYHEVSMRDDEFKIVGNPDMILYIAALSAYHICELKSIAHDRWKEMARPLPEHVLQVLFYWYLMRKLGYRLTDRLSILYISKGYEFSAAKKPYKEFVIDPEANLSRLDPYLEEARLLLLSKTSDELPARDCKTLHSTNARKCEACDICFAGEV